MSELGQQIRDERQRRGLTGREAGDLAGISQAAVSQVEAGVRQALSPSAAALIQALGLRVVLVPDEGEE
jgi:transcriptional regulator with XRE-family HTH domain